MFMVHGIGPVCDLRFRSMVECGEYHTVMTFFRVGEAPVVMLFIK